MLTSQKHSCRTCARRKVRCSKTVPCSYCAKVQIDCVYLAPAPSQRHRKRPPDEDLLHKISEYEALLRTHNILFQPLDNAWIPSNIDNKSTQRTGLNGESHNNTIPESVDGDTAINKVYATRSPLQLSEQHAKPNLTPMWLSLPREVGDPSKARAALGPC